MRLGGRCHDRIYHVDRADQLDVTHSGFFLNSSLAPVLRFRRSFVSVCSVLVFFSVPRYMAFPRPRLLRHGVVGVPLFPRLILGPIGFLLIFMDFISGPWTP